MNHVSSKATKKDKKKFVKQYYFIHNPCMKDFKNLIKGEIVATLQEYSSCNFKTYLMATYNASYKRQ
jgi:hypothetical protein